MRLFRKYLILSHRYLGIAACLLVLMWFATGIVMMYTGGMPMVSEELVLERADPLDLAAFRITPEEASDLAGYADGIDGQGTPPPISMVTLLGRPAYRIGPLGQVTVFADNGEFLTELDEQQGAQVAASFARVDASKVQFVGAFDDVDQWTFQKSPPFLKYAIDDGLGTEIYVQPYTGDIEMITTSQQRMYAWMGTIPHWFYFSALRTNQSLWFNSVVYTAEAVCLLTLLGIVLGFVLFRKPKPFNLKKAIPYAGPMRWHYVTGVIFGLFTLTWAYSGVLSMEPFDWTNGRGLTVRPSYFSGGTMDLAAFRPMDPVLFDEIAGGRPIKQVQLRKIQGQHFYDVRLGPQNGFTPKEGERLHQPYRITPASDPNQILVSADTLVARSHGFSVDDVKARLAEELPGERIVDAELLNEYDSYYYSRQNLHPLPVVRVKFDDPAETWVYVDPRDSNLLTTVHRLERVERWAYNGLHSLDFKFLYDKRPLWDITMLVLCFGGLFTSGVGAYLGLRRVFNGTMKAALKQATALFR